MTLLEFCVQSLINGIVTGTNYSVLAAGLTLIFGILGIVSFAHGEFYMLGAFFAYYLMVIFGISYLLSIPLSMIAVGFFAAACGRLIVNPIKERHWSAIILSTYGLSFILLDGSLLVFGGENRDLNSPFSREVLRFGNLYISQQKLIIIGASILLILLLRYIIQKTTLGKMMRASAQNKTGAALVGINLDLIYTWTFAIGCALAAAAGSLLGATTYIYPTMGHLVLLKGFVIVILGGMGSITGAVIGGMILGIVEAFVDSFAFPALSQIMGFAIVIIILLVMPQGLMGTRVRG